MKQLKKIELLSPAKDYECGIEAIKHGADAVYIGASAYGARAAACNSVKDIKRLASFAHEFGAKVYVTVNTILKDSEILPVQNLIWDLFYAGADALLVQDMALLSVPLPPIEIHASTQMDIRDAEKVRFLSKCGIKRVVLARELSLKEISEIHAACPEVELEAFVHGALCVSYSGQCYASECCFGRSANRGECAQFCRLSFDLLDADRQLMGTKHYLSLKDMNRCEYLEEMINAGVSSFKIEGRLKDVSYVKNITAYYNRALDRLISERQDLVRSSDGKSIVTFTPNPYKSFNRGFTDYFLNGDSAKDSICSFESPKSKGEYMGTVSRSSAGVVCINYADKAKTDVFSNGDGICYINSDGKLEGCRVNRVEKEMLYLHDSKIRIPYKSEIYRNYDQKFLTQLQHGNTADRKISVDMVISQTENGFRLSVTDQAGYMAEYSIEQPKEQARTAQQMNIKVQLSKLGETNFTLNNLTINFDEEWFIPSSRLSELRRGAISNLLKERLRSFERTIGTQEVICCPNPPLMLSGYKLDFMSNVMNSVAEQFYRTAGAGVVEPAYERNKRDNAVIMTCRHCLRYVMGVCCKENLDLIDKPKPKYLRMSDGRTFELEFDCRNCQMKVLDTASAQR